MRREAKRWWAVCIKGCIVSDLGPETRGFWVAVPARGKAKAERKARRVLLMRWAQMKGPAIEVSVSLATRLPRTTRRGWRREEDAAFAEMFR